MYEANAVEQVHLQILDELDARPLLQMRVHPCYVVLNLHRIRMMMMTLSCLLLLLLILLRLLQFACGPSGGADLSRQVLVVYWIVEILLLWLLPARHGSCCLPMMDDGCVVPRLML